MPNIFKSFLKPAVNSYVFPDAESLQVEESPEPEGEQAEETPLQEQEPEAPHTAAADALLSLTGARATQAVVDRIFEKFCVGK